MYKLLAENFTKSDYIMLFKHPEIKKVFVGMRETFEKRSLVGLKRKKKKKKGVAILPSLAVSY